MTRLSDRLEMTIAVDWDVNIKPNKQTSQTGWTKHKALHAIRAKTNNHLSKTQNFLKHETKSLDHEI